MSTVNLPLWLDDAHWNAGIERHPKLAEKHENLAKKLDECEPEEFSEIMFELVELRKKIVK